MLADLIYISSLWTSLCLHRHWKSIRQATLSRLENLWRYNGTNIFNFHRYDPCLVGIVNWTRLDPSSIYNLFHMAPEPLSRNQYMSPSKTNRNSSNYGVCNNIWCTDRNIHSILRPSKISCRPTHVFFSYESSKCTSIVMSCFTWSLPYSCILF